MSTIGPNYTVIPNDWDSITYIINDLSRIITETPQFTNYLLRNGSRSLTANWNVGSFQITAKNFVSTTPTSSGIQPYATSSQTLNTNLNADLLDGHHATDFALSTLYNLSGTTNQVNLSGSGTGVLSTRNITLSLPQDIDTTSSPQFANMGIGAAASNINGINMVFSVSSSLSITGIAGTAVQTKSSFGTGTVQGLSFGGYWNPTTVTSARTLSMVRGASVGMGGIMPSSAYNTTITTIDGFNTAPLLAGGGGAGVFTVTTLNHYSLTDINTSEGAVCATQIGYYCPSLTGAIANWGLAINTQSYINANLSIGKKTTPSYPIDCVGDINSTGVYRISGSDKSTNWNAAYTHISNNGTDHSYINQSVKTTDFPTFAGLTLTNFLEDIRPINGVLTDIIQHNILPYWTTDPWIAGTTGVGVGSNTFYMNIIYSITGAVINDSCYVYSANSVQLDSTPVYKRWRFYTTYQWGGITDITSWVGWNQTPIVPTDIGKHISFKMINGTLYASNANGATQTIVTTGVTISPGVNYNLYIEYDGTSVRFYVNGILKVTNSTNIPTNELFYISYYIQTTATSSCAGGPIKTEIWTNKA
jgi:hypothetical protein